MSVPVLILTRPLDDGKALAETLASHGKIILAPMTEIKHRKLPSPIVLPKAWLATSRHAISHVDDDLKKLPWFAVGKRTVEAAEQAGLPEPAAWAETAAELVKQLKKTSSHQYSPLLYLSAEHIRHDFAESLAPDGFDVIRAICYEATAKNSLPDDVIAMIEGGQRGAISFYSTRSAKIFYELAAHAGLSEQLRRLIACCISNEAASACDSNEIKIAQSPTTEAMLKLQREILSL